MIDSLALLTVGSAFFVVAASPGTATVATATVAMGSGRGAGLRFGTGLSVGPPMWGLVATTGLGTILQASAHALAVLKILGGVYLLRLTFGAFRSARSAATGLTPARGRGNGFRRGLLLNLSNPKAVVAWMATLSLGVNEGQGPTQVLVATALCIALGFAIYTGYVLAFSTAGAMQTYARLRRWIDGLTAGLFALAGLGLLRSAIAR